MSLIIFTELDEILSAAKESDFELIARVVKDLRQRQIPLISISSKTRAEVVDWLRKFDLDTPFIVEQGSGIFIPQGDNRFGTTDTSQIDGYNLHQLGCSYTEARAALKAVQEEISKILRGFGDMDDETIQPLIGASKIAAQKAKAREFSEYFITPNRLEITQLQEIAAEYGFKILSGDKLSMIMGGGSDVATAINWLKQSFISTDGKIKTVGLGSTKQDLIMLEVVDLSVVIPSSSEIDPCFSDQDWEVANNSGVEGWVESIEQICREGL